MLQGFVLVDVANIHDPDRYQRYRDRVGPSFDAAGGEYLVRGGEPERLKGKWCPTRLVIARFPSLAAISDWWSSSDYQAIQQDRAQATDSRFLAFEADTGENGTSDRCGAFLLATSGAGSPDTGSFVASFCGFASKQGASFVIASTDINVLEGAWRPAEIALAGFPDRASAARCMSEFRDDASCEQAPDSDAAWVILLSRFQERNP